MNNSVLNSVSTHVPYSKLKSLEVSLLTKPKMDALEGFQTIQGCKEDGYGVGCMYLSNGVQKMKHSSIVSSSVSAHLEVDYTSSPVLRDNGNDYSLPLFSGDNGRAFVSWLFAIESYFKYNEFSEHAKCEMVISCLRNDVLRWYNGVACAKNNNGVFKIKYWHKLKCCLKDKYLNEAVMNDLKNEFQNLRMDSMCVKDYTMVFNELYFILGSSSDCFDKRNKFYNGLSSEIQEWITIEQISSFDLLCELAILSENLIHEHEVYMESLARDNAKLAAFMCFYEGFKCEVPLTYGVIFGDKGTVLVTGLGNVIVQGIVRNLKLYHEPGFNDIRRFEVYLGSQKTNDHACVCVNSNWFEMNINPKKLGVNLRQKHVVVAFDPGGIQRKMQNQTQPKKSKARMGLVCYKVDDSLVCEPHVVDVVKMTPRYFMMVFDPGGAIVSSPLEVAFEQESLNLLNSFKKVHVQLIRIPCFSIKGWCKELSLIIRKFEDKFLLNKGRLQQVLRWREIILQSIKVTFIRTFHGTIPNIQYKTFCVYFRIKAELFALYLKIYLAIFDDPFMVAILRMSSLIWLWNEQNPLGILSTIRPQRLSPISAEFLRKQTCLY